jgi:hypothetical protein
MLPIAFILLVGLPRTPRQNPTTVGIFCLSDRLIKVIMGRFGTAGYFQLTLGNAD